MIDPVMVPVMFVGNSRGFQIVVALQHGQLATVLPKLQ